MTNCGQQHGAFWQAKEKDLIKRGTKAPHLGLYPFDPFLDLGLGKRPRLVGKRQHFEHQLRFAAETGVSRLVRDNDMEFAALIHKRR